MRWIVFSSALAALSEANHVLHEKRETRVHELWQQTQRVHPDAIVPVRIGLKQNNLDAGPERLQAISHPESESYGKYLSQEEVHDLFAPSANAVENVREWLFDSGIERNAIAHSDNKGWIAANIPAGDAERLFATELYEYEHSRSGHIRIGCDSYHLPAHLTEHIDFVTPGVKMSATLKKRTRPTGQSWGPSWSRPKTHAIPFPGWNHPWHLPPHAHNLPEDLRYCGGNMTPPCWRYLYKLPKGHINDSVNDLGLFEQGDYFSQTDVSAYFNMTGELPIDTAPKVLSVDGGLSPVPASSSLVGGESDVDLDIAISLIYPQSVILYQVDDQVYSPAEIARDNTFNTFLDAIDGSYCNYTAYGITGNSPGIDPTYPDPAATGYKGTLQCGVYKPTRVISASYGESEGDFPIPYVKRQCNEFMKLGLQGHTMFVSSSDFGVGNSPGDPTESGCISGNGQNQTIYNADYPDGCPWITVVGATMIYPNQTVLDPESALQVDLSGPGRPEAYKFFSSAGGFSNYFPTAFFQKRAVAEYFARHDPGHPYYIANAEASNIGEHGGIYNRAGRGYPDVSANGAYMTTVIGGSHVHEFGTSLAAPLWASVITLINQQRTIAGKGPVGYINTALYENPWMLTDIRNGSNPNCGSSGFAAVEGWDPVTGLGTPNYPKMLEFFMRLP